jgi:hypothetical protein
MTQLDFAALKQTSFNLAHKNTLFGAFSLFIYKNVFHFLRHVDSPTLAGIVHLPTDSRLVAPVNTA